jgi:hypothetical protein
MIVNNVPCLIPVKYYDDYRDGMIGIVKTKVDNANYTHKSRRAFDNLFKDFTMEVSQYTNFESFLVTLDNHPTTEDASIEYLGISTDDPGGYCYHCVHKIFTHDLVTGRSLTVVLHILNQTLFDCHCKWQATAETTSFGSKFVVAKIAVEQMIHIHMTLQYLSNPILGKTYMFGDNPSVRMNASLHHLQLNKRHNALAYHRVSKAISCADMLGFYRIPSKYNYADILSKHKGFPQVWSQLKALLYWDGETKDIPDKVAMKAQASPPDTEGSDRN